MAVRWASAPVLRSPVPRRLPFLVGELPASMSTVWAAVIGMILADVGHAPWAQLASVAEQAT
jgi:hypothetical protein